MYHYYVSFMAVDKKGRQGAGYVQIKREKPIRTGDDVYKLSLDIKKTQKLASATIMNWMPLEG